MILPTIHDSQSHRSGAVKVEFQKQDVRRKRESGGGGEMTRFLKRNPCVIGFEWRCDGCAFDIHHNSRSCLKHKIIYPGPRETMCIDPDVVFVLVPRPPDGTHCRDLEGNIKVVGRDA